MNMPSSPSPAARSTNAGTTSTVDDVALAYELDQTQEAIADLYQQMAEETAPLRAEVVRREAQARALAAELLCRFIERAIPEAAAALFVTSSSSRGAAFAPYPAVVYNADGSVMPPDPTTRSWKHLFNHSPDTAQLVQVMTDLTSDNEEANPTARLSSTEAILLVDLRERTASVITSHAAMQPSATAHAPTRGRDRAENV